MAGVSGSGSGPKAKGNTPAWMAAMNAKKAASAGGPKQKKRKLTPASISPPPFTQSTAGASSSQAAAVIHQSDSRQVGVVVDQTGSQPAAPGSKDGAGAVTVEALRPSDSGLWDHGVSEELFNIIQAPRRFADLTPLSEEDVLELARAEEYGMKCASLMKALTVVKRKAAKLNEEVQSVREGAGKTREELLSVRKAYGKMKNDRDKLLTDRDSFKKKYSDAMESLTGFKDKYNLIAGNLTTAHSTIEGLKADLEKSKADLEKSKSDLQEANSQLKASEEEADRCRNLIADSAEGSFNNALAQIRYLNPGLDFNTAGMHFRAYVSGEELVPPPSPGGDSVTAFEPGLEVEGGETHTSGVKNAASDANEARQ